MLLLEVVEMQVQMMHLMKRAADDREKENKVTWDEEWRSSYGEGQRG